MKTREMHLMMKRASEEFMVESAHIICSPEKVLLRSTHYGSWRFMIPQISGPIEYLKCFNLQNLFH